MKKILFKDLAPSEMARAAAMKHIDGLVERFPYLEGCRITMTLSMHNSPVQAGPDAFAAKFRCTTGKYKGVILEKKSDNLYKAMADLSDHLLERLNRFGDKERVKGLKRSRKFKQSLQQCHFPAQEVQVS